MGWELRRRGDRSVGSWAGVTVVAALVATLGGCASAPREKPLDAEQRALAVASFDKVWETVRDRHYDPKLGGVDWDGAKTELRPRVEAATTASQARGVMTELVERLHQSHFMIVPKEAYDDRVTTSGRGDVGLTIRVVGEDALVTRVDPGSGGAEAGVKPGWILTEVEGRPVDRTLKRLAKTYAGKPQERMVRSFAVQSSFRGEPGTEAKAVFVDGAGSRRALKLARKAPEHAPVVLGNLPPIDVRFAKELLPGNVGYIRFDAFLDPARIMPEFNGAMREYANASGIIIDMRGNIGGLGVMSTGVGSWFVERTGVKLGTQRLRDSQVNFVLNPRPEPYTGPLAVLIDECSVSTAEILAGGLKDIGRARVFGVRSAGEALPSQFEILPNGDRLQYVFADYTSAGGKPLEGLGVTPDVEAPPERETLLRGGDPALDAARAWIAQGGKLN